MKKLTITFYVLMLFMCSCGGSSSGGFLPPSNTDSTIDSSQYYYQPVDGDGFVYNDSIVDSDEGNSDYQRRSGFLQVDANLFTIYLYGDDSTASYMKEISETRAAELDPWVAIDKTYYSLQDGDEIIHDDLTYFSRIDLSTRSGSDEPDSVILDNEYTQTQVDVLLSSADPTQVKGSYEFEATIIPEEIESISVTAGTYECLRFSVSGESVWTITDTVPDTVTTSSFTGYRWYAKDLGLIKIELDYQIQVTGPSPLSKTRNYSSELAIVE